MREARPVQTLILNCMETEYTYKMQVSRIYRTTVTSHGSSFVRVHVCDITNSNIRPQSIDGHFIVTNAGDRNSL